MARDLTRDARLVYISLWNEADDEGRLRGSEPYLHGVLFPYDPGSWFSDCIGQLVATGRIIRYESNGETLMFLPKFPKHQRINRPTESRFPPPTEASVITHGALTDGSLVPQALARAREELGTGNREQGTGIPTPPAAPEEPQEPAKVNGRLRRIPMDQPRESFKGPERIRYGFYDLWRKKYGAEYPQEPGADQAQAIKILHDHRDHDRGGTWLEFARKACEAYLEIDDDKIVNGSNHAFRHIGMKMQKIVGMIGGST